MRRWKYTKAEQKEYYELAFDVQKWLAYWNKLVGNTPTWKVDFATLLEYGSNDKGNPI